MSGCVYLLSTLPHLSIDFSFPDDVSTNRKEQDSIPTEDGFLAVCSSVLSSGDTKNIECAINSPYESTIPLVHDLIEYRFSIVDAVAQKRWSVLRGGTYVHTIQNGRVPVSADASIVLAEAQNAKNPLEREGIIGRALWAYLEHRNAQYQFSIENVIIYGYKLKLYYRFRNFVKTKGQTAWEKLTSTLVEKAGFSRDGITGGHK